MELDFDEPDRDEEVLLDELDLDELDLDLAREEDFFDDFDELL
jgi:hypothetical protein